MENIDYLNACVLINIYYKNIIYHDIIDHRLYIFIFMYKIKDTIHYIVMLAVAINNILFQRFLSTTGILLVIIRAIKYYLFIYICIYIYI